MYIISTETNGVLISTCFTKLGGLYGMEMWLIFCPYNMVILNLLLVTVSSIITIFNSLRPSDAIWWHRFRPTLLQIMACCLSAPSHYLNQFWLIISEILWHTLEDICMGNKRDISHWDVFQNDKNNISTTSPGSQWVKDVSPGRSVQVHSYVLEYK